MPERTGLYRIVYQEHENLKTCWEDQFRSEFGVLREVVTDTLESYLDCGILARGFARIECQGCGSR